MKKRRNLLLTALLAAVLLCGCTAPAAEETMPPEPAATEPVVRVETVDELLAAIEPGANIVLAAQSFDFAGAADYGKETASPYYSWDAWSEGFVLTVDAVDDLSIRGADGTVLRMPVAGLRLQNCDNVVLEDLTLEDAQAEADGPGLVLAGCKDGVLRRLSVSGHDNGIRLDLCNHILLEQCRLAQWSGAGISIANCRDVEIAQCQLAPGETAYEGIFLYSCREVTLRDSTVSGGRLQNLIDSSQSRRVTLENCTFTDNQIQDSVFSIYDQEPLTLDGCRFAGNRIFQWLQRVPMDQDEGVWVQDAAGTPLTEADLQKLQPEQGSLPEQKQVRVSTVDEFLMAIGPDTAVILESPLYDLSEAADYGQEGQEYYFWEETFDGPQLVIFNVENFSIRSEQEGCTISALPRYADVLTFRNCWDITLSGFTAGHVKELGSCVGGVLNASCCTGLTVENCGLFGCGVLGLQTDGCRNVTVKDCDIYECSLGGISMTNTHSVAIDGCTFRDLGGEALGFWNCTQVAVDGEKMPETEA